MPQFMQRVIVFANRKGGCGKTTTAVNVAHALAQRGRRVLLLDLDPQAHATLSLGVTADRRHLYHLLQGDAPLSAVVQETRLPGLFLVPSARDLLGFEIEQADRPGSPFRLAEMLQDHTPAYDYLIMDPPPTVGLLTVSALVAAQEVYIPMPMHFLAMEGLAEMMRLIYRVNANWNWALRMMGVIPTFYAPNTRISREIAGEIVANFGEGRLLPAIRMNICLAEAPGHGKTALEYAPKSAGALDYTELAAHIDEVTP